MTLPKRWNHQSRILEQTKDDAGHAAFWEQGSGKSRYILDTAEYLRRKHSIDAAFILSTNGAHRQWIEDELPYWLPDSPWEGFYWTSGKFKTKKGQAYIKRALEAPFPLVTMNYEAVMTSNAHGWMKKFFKKRGVLYTLDESTAIKTASAKRTHRIVCSGRWCDYRRILTGTPVTNHGPFDLFKQLQFLDYEFWKKHGFQTFSEFKTFFGKWGTPGKARTSTGKLYEYPKLLRDSNNRPLYRNLDKLHNIVSTISTRILKEDVFDIPPKVYSKLYFDMTPEQSRVYKELRDSFMTFLQSGELVSVPLAIVRLMRLQQVTSNYLPTDNEPVTLIDKKHNPRLDTLVTRASQSTHQGIVWARFHLDVDLIADALSDRCVRADGKVTGEKRAKAIRAFKNGDIQFLVSNPACQGVSRGQNLGMAHSEIYYNNTFSYEDRKQSEDRAHRGTTTHSVDYTDIVAVDTVDLKILQSLRNNLDVASTINGDMLREWI